MCVYIYILTAIQVSIKLLPKFVTSVRAFSGVIALF